MTEPTADRSPQPYWNPFVAGVGLGLTLLLSFIVLGAGLGASGGIARAAAATAHVVAPQAVETNAYMGAWFEDRSPLAYYLVFMGVGAIAGGFLSAWAARRVHAGVDRGPNVSKRTRLLLALAGGVLVGIGSRLASGCTSGQALTGGSLLLTGSWVTLMAIFAGGFAAAWFTRRQWL